MRSFVAAVFIDLLDDPQLLGGIDGTPQPFEARHHFGKARPSQAPQFFPFGCKYHRIPQAAGSPGCPSCGFVRVFDKRLHGLDGKVPCLIEQSARFDPSVFQIQPVRSRCEYDRSTSEGIASSYGLIYCREK